MEINLVHNNLVVGKIYPSFASNITGEIKGLLIPNEEYHKIRVFTNKYSQIFHTVKPISLIEKGLFIILKYKYRRHKHFYSKFVIEIDNKKVSNEFSEIRIYDNLMLSGLGNPIINIESWNLQTNKLDNEIDIYEIVYPYPNAMSLTINIKYDSKVLLEY